MTTPEVLKKKKKKVTTYWYAEPLNPATNESIARELAKTADVSEAINLDVGDGSPHSAYQLPGYQIVSMLYAGKKQFSFKFNIYRRQGKNGKIAEWKFGEKKKSGI